MAEHEHHDRASQWLAGVTDFAWCPITQGALVRFLVRMGETPDTIRAVLAAVDDHPRGHWWPDDLSYTAADLRGVQGHRQVTDAYLASLARHHEGLLATTDQALATWRPGQCVLLPTDGGD